jgi:pyridoxamine 5'-phosphate oxidase
MIDAQIASIRKEYIRASLLEEKAATNAITQFSNWWNDALQAQIEEINAFALSTVDQNNFPHSRIVLLKSFSENGFIFFTNYLSTKGQNIAHNQQVSILFFWKELERQVRIQGIASKIPKAESEEYFFSRPISSQIGAHASAQSQVLSNRQALEGKVAKLEKQFETEPITMPDYWGGYQVQPLEIEFWQGRESRLHDRLRYTLQDDKAWKIERLSP